LALVLFFGFFLINSLTYMMHCCTVLWYFPGSWKEKDRHKKKKTNHSSFRHNPK